ncbi:LytTR family DNA-binding domain-containing protein [Desulfocurvibacter africanus]|uniref:Two component transcriptional regulator, LytTR family n=1 Tax=Desulfocurvibacter africanus subsp. africanus str. Walvis Bay TaxID=690850 RepID=F3YZM9_DESAF|nr:LytTR family DNA-binding domain-containing protein [Desulfocurvibacter africanus]EGJ49728.1 two component transcriptional regulator, LytTR family [Desulfocurvibacter africanus subsp. africanus str. Walvis Bay]
MNKLRALLLHGDPAVRSGLRDSLSHLDFMRILGEAITAYEAMELLEHIPYGVIFLGLELPGEVSGLELAQMLMGRKSRPALVFIASDESKAYKAFELEALDYLIWPAGRERLSRTVDRLRQLRSGFMQAPRPSLIPERDYGGGSEEESMVQVPMGEEDEDRFLSALRQAWDYSQRGKPPEIEKLAINQDGRMVLLPFDQIVFVEAYEDYSYVHTASQKYLTSYRLKNLEDRLKPYRFFRVHRKYLVNLDMVTEISSMPGSNFMLRTAGKTRIELPVSRRRIGELKQILGL